MFDGPSKSPYKRLVFWQNINSHHQGPALDALARTDRFEVVWSVGATVQGSWREEHGWPTFESNAIRLIVNPDKEERLRLLSERKDESLHIFTGIHNDTFQRTAFLEAVRQRCNTAMLSEYQPAKKGRGILKRIVHTLYRILYAKSVKAVFCIGSASKRWYESVGYSKDILVDWRYTPIPPGAFTRHPWTNEGVPKLIYVSSLLPVKGIDLLIDALLQLGHLDWSLEIYGGGTLKQEMVEKVEKSPLKSRFTFADYVPYAEAMERLAAADLALVPSRHDGWGAVVSEALILGVPVLATRNAGASDMLTAEWLGIAVEDASVPAIKSELEKLIPKLPFQTASRERILAWAHRLDGQTIAEHMADSLDAIERGQRPPVPPWLLAE